MVSYKLYTAWTTRRHSHASHHEFGLWHPSLNITTSGLWSVFMLISWAKQWSWNASKQWGVPSASCSLLLLQGSMLGKFCLQILLATALLYWELHSLVTTYCPLLADDLSLDWFLTQLSLCIAAAFHCRVPWSHSSWWCFSFIFCSSRSTPILTISTSQSHILLWFRAKTFLGNSLYLKIIATLFYYQGDISVSAQFLCIWLHTFSDITSQNNGILV